MENLFSKKKRGGKRPGAGAPKINEMLRKERITFRLPNWVNKYIKMQPNQSKFIETIVVEKLNITPPL